MNTSKKSTIIVPNSVIISMSARRQVRCDVLERHPDEDVLSFQRRVIEQQNDDLRFRTCRTMIEATPMQKDSV